VRTWLTEVNFRRIGQVLRTELVEILDDRALLRDVGVQLPPHVPQFALQGLDLRILRRLRTALHQMRVPIPNERSSRGARPTGAVDLLENKIK
jgi:hypothetical protein